MNILALDLGTKTGYAYNRGNDFQAGTWALATPKEVTQWGLQRLTRRKDLRVRRLCDAIAALGAFDIVIFEDVEFQTFRLQQQLWAALRSSIWLCASATFFEAVGVQTLKKFAGARSQDKEAMALALKRQHPDLWKPAYCDNAIDAVWLHLYARKNLQRLNTQPIIP